MANAVEVFAIRRQINTAEVKAKTSERLFRRSARRRKVPFVGGVLGGVSRFQSVPGFADLTMAAIRTWTGEKP